MFDKLQEVDTEGVEPRKHIVSHEHPLRDDKVHGELTAEEALTNAPKTRNGYIAVPKFLKPK